MKRTLEELRTQLWSTLDDLTADRIAPAKANAVANISGKVLKSLAIEIDYQRLTGQHRPIAMMERG